MSKEAKILIGIGVLVAVGVSAMILLNAKDTSTAKPKAGGDKLIREDSYQTNKDVKVTIVEFGDYQCPACGAAQPIVKQIKSEFGPKINFVFRNLPLQQHPNAKVGAEAAEAAGAQGKYYEMNELLYANQSQWSTQANPISIFVTYAQKLGLDTGQFEAEVKASKYADKIQRDLDDSQSLSLSSTPSFFVNGTAVEQASGLKAAIEAALKTAAPAAQ
ncbi:disulfide bond formation protein DsbA [Patescibacteria group bacterium]|nr:disulfide bond formation protein DsbA [Patescibacteria group bacterium]